MSLPIARLARLSCVSALALGLFVPCTAQAQQGAVPPVFIPQVSVPIVQAVPQKSAGMRLNDALGRLARNFQDIAALTEAGQASLDLGDAQAAIGFYRRALTIQPGNAAVKAGLAGAYVLSEDPFTAIELFDEAEKAGPIDPARLSDRGLAFDLVGDATTAQHYYRQSLAAAPNDETLRRLGLSQAISRDRKGMDVTLAPLLQKQDKAAWRTRAFGLAILGQVEEAEGIARQTMPAEMANAITAYLRYMPRLTAAQQAGAGNLGRFPRASEIGSDDPRMAHYSRSRVQVAAAAPQPVVAQPKGKRDDKGRRDKGKAAVPSAPALAAVPPPEPNVGRETAPVEVRLAKAAPVAASPRVAPPPAPKPVPAPTIAPAKPLPVSSAPVPAAPVPAAATPQPGFAGLEPGAARPVSFDLAQAPAATAPPARPVPAPVPAPAAQRQPASIDEAFADLAQPSREVEPQSGAVDVRLIRPAAAPVATPAGKVQPGKEPVSKEPAGREPAAKDRPVAGKGADKAGTAKAPADKGGSGKAGADKAATGKDAKGKDAKGKPVAPSHPSRIWVQVAAGRDKSALAFDWRKFGKEDPALFKARQPHVSAWGQTNRLLAGPFASARDAAAFLAQLKKAGFDGAFVWTSPAGQAVDALATGK